MRVADMPGAEIDEPGGGRHAVRVTQQVTQSLKPADQRVAHAAAREVRAMKLRGVPKDRAQDGGHLEFHCNEHTRRVDACEARGRAGKVEGAHVAFEKA